MNTHTKIPKRSRAQRGMTLIEIMIVLALVAMVAGLAVPSFLNQLRDGRVQGARVEMSNIANALDLYRLKKKKYPSTAEGLPALTSTGEMNIIPKDPWDNDYIYVASGASSYSLSSLGPDGISGSEDDIVHGAEGTGNP